MGYTDTLLDDIRSQIQPDETVVKEAKARREIVLTAAASLAGSTRKIRSGSLAHGTAICPIHLRDKGLDADGAVVLPSTWRELGPETVADEPPNDTVEQFRAVVQDAVRAKGYPNAEATTKDMKRAILVKFNQELPDGEDPTVDLIVGLPRTAGGLWIPNLTSRRWDPSHPEKHTELFLGSDDNKRLRTMRARAVRLAKAENKRTDPAALCSFNIEALAIMYLNEVMPLPVAIRTLWSEGARDLARRLTPDPAHVSADIRVKDRAAAVERWADNAARIATAIDVDGYAGADQREVMIREVLRPLWPDYVPDEATGSTKARTQATFAQALRKKQPLHASATGGLALSGGLELKRTNSFGGR